MSVSYPKSYAAPRGYRVTIHELWRMPVTEPPHISTASVALALGELVGARAYVAGIAAGGTRFDLDGNPCGLISDAERQQAKARLLSMDGQSPEKLAEQAEAAADKAAERARIAAKKAERAEIKRLEDEARAAKAAAKALKEEARMAKVAAQ